MTVLTRIGVFFSATILLLLVLVNFAPAHATVTFCGPDTEGGSCEGLSEQKVFLDNAKAVLTSNGDVGAPGSSQVMVIDSLGGMLNMFYDSAGGFGTITPADLPHPLGKQIDFNGLSFQIPGFTFTDMVFDVQLTPTENPLDSFTAAVFGPGHTLIGTNIFSDAADTDKQFGITSTTPISEITILSTTGFDEVKHLEVSGVAAVPEPSTWALGLLGFAFVGLMGYRRRMLAV